MVYLFFICLKIVRKSCEIVHSCQHKVEDEESSYLNDDPDQIPSPPESPTLSDMGCEGLIGGDTESWDLNDSEDNNVFKSDTV